MVDPGDGNKTAVAILATLVLVFIVSNIALALMPPALSFWDEQVYNYASTLILRGQSCSTIALTVGSSTVPIAAPCNYEHPPLVKLLGAVSLYFFDGIQQHVQPGSMVASIVSLLSLRTTQLTMGSLSIPLVYLIARDISHDRRLAVLAAVFLVLEPLYGLFSRTDYLDVPMIFFALCGYAVYFGGRHLGKVGSNALCGIFLALSILSKETGIVMTIPLVAYHLLFAGSDWRGRFRYLLLLVGVEAFVAAAGLQLYDTIARTPFLTFVDQIQYMVAYSGRLVCPNLCNNPGPSPWYFFLTSNYWMVEVSYNPVLLWSIFIWVPVGAYFLGRKLVKKEGPDGADRLFVFALLLVVVGLLANELFYLGGRIIWVWYYLPIVPGLALGEAYLLTRAGIPLWLRGLLGVSVFAGYFLAYLWGPSYLMYD